MQISIESVIEGPNVILEKIGVSFIGNAQMNHQDDVDLSIHSVISYKTKQN